jgi:hypothetical protein
MSIPSVFTGTSIYAMLPPSTPEWRKIIKIEMTPDGPQSSVVQDYTLVKTLTDAVASVLDEADSDDTPEEQQLLMAAWQALATYLSSCDDEDKTGAMTALKIVSNLMADGPDDGPLPTGTFGATTQTAAVKPKIVPKGKGGKPLPAGKDGKSPPVDKNGNPLPSWLVKKVMAKKAKSEKAADTFSCLYCARDFGTEQGLINHLKTVHAAREKQTKMTTQTD